MVSTFSTPNGKFQANYDKCDGVVKKLFSNLLLSIKDLSGTEYYPRDKKDYCLKRNILFCAITPQSKKNTLKVELRIDPNDLHSKTLILEEFYFDKGGPRWTKFLIDNEHQIEEATKLIKEVYKFS